MSVDVLRLPEWDEWALFTAVGQVRAEIEAEDSALREIPDEFMPERLEEPDPEVWSLVPPSEIGLMIAGATTRYAIEQRRLSMHRHDTKSPKHLRPRVISNLGRTIGPTFPENAKAA